MLGLGFLPPLGWGIKLGWVGEVKRHGRPGSDRACDGGQGGDAESAAAGGVARAPSAMRGAPSRCARPESEPRQGQNRDDPPRFRKWRLQRDRRVATVRVRSRQRAQAVRGRSKRHGDADACGRASDPEVPDWLANRKTTHAPPRRISN